MKICKSRLFSLFQEAKNIGFPVLIKAVMGGGGKGMRIVRSADEFLSALDAAKREAMKAFGDDRVIMERYIPKSRHIEVQLMGDKHGNYLHFYERDCTVQRRHQKVVEEAPSSVWSPELRTEMGEAAVRVAQACQDEGAGTPTQAVLLVDFFNNFFFGDGKLVANAIAASSGYLLFNHCKIFVDISANFFFNSLISDSMSSFSIFLQHIGAAPLLCT